MRNVFSSGGGALRLAAWLLAAWLPAALGAAPAGRDSVVAPAELDSAAVPTGRDTADTGRRSFVARVMDYFMRPATPDTAHRVDWGVLPGPHFSSTAGLGLGIVASGVYRTARADTATAASNVAVYGDVTTKGFLMAGVRGCHVLPRGRFRAEYRLYAYTFPTEFYGMGVDACDADANRTDYRRVKLEAQGRFLVRVARNLYVGPVAGFRYVDASRVAPAGLPLFGGQPLRGLTALSAGLSLTYDTRDFMTNAYRGWLVQLDQTFTPAALADGFGYATTELTTSTYRQVWRGGVLAGELHACLNYGNPAWCMMAEVGSGSRMRGYYEGRYRDKHIVEMQVELRQRIWRRHGAALWGGAAQVFARPADVRWRRVLPNAGLGYRWEFRNRVNVRVDYGFTRNGGGFLFSLNEAF